MTWLGLRILRFGVGSDSGTSSSTCSGSGAGGDGGGGAGVGLGGGEWSITITGVGVAANLDADPEADPELVPSRFRLRAARRALPIDVSFRAETRSVPASGRKVSVQTGTGLVHSRTRPSSLGSPHSRSAQVHRRKERETHRKTTFLSTAKPLLFSSCLFFLKKALRAFWYPCGL